MSSVQSVGPWFNFDNVKVVKTDVDYLVDKNDLEIISTRVAAGTVNCTLPSNPEAGESHRFVAPATSTITIIAQVGSQMTFNPSGGGVATQAPSCLVPQGTVVDVSWSDSSSGWVATCCANAVGGG
jgi:hypothetical protein